MPTAHPPTPEAVPHSPSEPKGTKESIQKPIKKQLQLHHLRRQNTQSAEGRKEGRKEGREEGRKEGRTKVIL